MINTATFSAISTTPFTALIGWLAMVNVALLIFNLVPAFPLDGGRIARSVAWKVTGERGKGTRFAGYLGQGFGGQAQRTASRRRASRQASGCYHPHDSISRWTLPVGTSTSYFGW